MSRANLSCADVQERLTSTEVSYTQLEAEKNDLKQVAEQLEAKVQTIISYECIATANCSLLTHNNIYNL